MKTTFQYDHYYAYSELTEALQTLVKNHPDLLATKNGKKNLHLNRRKKSGMKNL